jgi:raffinose/stachyose/melibiose transport system substrate-binding protein
MRSRFRKAIVLVASLVLLASACGDDDDETSDTSSVGTQTEGTEPGGTQAEGTEAEGDGEITLKVMHWSDAMSSESEWWNEILDGFTELHPNVTIENNFVPFAQYLPTLEATIAGNELPDVFWGHVKVAELGRGGLAVAYEDVMDDELLGQLYPGPERQFTFDGHLYAMPWTSQIFGLFVNPAIMEELGVEPPETWDELIEIAGPLNEAGYIPVAWGNQEASTCPDFVLPLVTQYGGDVYALDDLTDPSVSWDSEPVVKALALLQKLAENKVFMPGINGVTEQQGFQVWLQGRAAMFYSGSWQPAAIEEQAPDELAESYTVEKVPALTADDVHWTGNGSGEGWVTKANSPNTEMALEFVRYLLGPDAYAKHITEAQNMPSITSGAQYLENPIVQEMTSWVETDGANHILFGQGSWEALSAVCSSILDGSITPEAGATKIQADVEATRD